MGLFDRLSKRANDPIVEFVNEEVVFLEGPYSGERVDAKSSMSLVPVWACVQLISGALASLPIRVYRTDANGTKYESPNHRTAKLLANPNPYMSGDELIECASSHLQLWGNAFLFKVKNGGQVDELWPLDPSRIKVTQSKEGTPLYVLDGKKGPYTQDTILHIRGLSWDGLVGLSPIQQAYQTLGNYKAAERFQGRFWANNATPGGVLTHPSRLSPDAAKRLRAQWTSAHAGNNSSSTAILEEGMSYVPLTLPIADARLLESIEANVLDCARLWQVPASMLQASPGKQGLHYTSTEMEYEHFVRFTLRRWLSRIEKSLQRDRDLFSPVGLGSQFTVAFDTSDLTRGDNKTIADINIALFKEGIITKDEVRAELGRQPLDPALDQAPALAMPTETLPTQTQS
jgi:HK97 family phage portal protein